MDRAVGMSTEEAGSWKTTLREVHPDNKATANPECWILSNIIDTNGYDKIM